MSNIPHIWLHCQLGDIVDYGSTQKVEPINISDGAWVLELEDIEKDTSKILQRLSFSQRKSKSTKNRFFVGEILYGKLRPYLNKVVRADKDGYCTTEIIPLTPSEWLDGRYLFYWLKHPVFLSYVMAVSHGLNMPRLGTEAGREAPFIFAPINEQKRIADKLDSILARVDTCRERLDRIPVILKRFRQAVLAAATSGKLTEDWRDQNPLPSNLARNEVSEQLELRRKKQPVGKKFKEPQSPDMTYWNNEIPSTWSIESVSAYAECLDHLRIPVTREKRSNTKRLYPYYGANGQVDMVDEYLFDDELVLVTEDETFYGREKPIAYRTSRKCWVNNHAHVLRTGNRARADYLCFCLMFYNVLPWLTGTTGRAKLTQSVLNSLPIAIPVQAETEEIVRRVEELFAYADRIEARYHAARAQTDKLTPAILAKAFRGELVPQDPNDEPASVLLERIRASRAENALTPKPKRNPKLAAK